MLQCEGSEAVMPPGPCPRRQPSLEEHDAGRTSELSSSAMTAQAQARWGCGRSHRQRPLLSRRHGSPWTQHSLTMLRCSSTPAAPPANPRWVSAMHMRCKWWVMCLVPELRKGSAPLEYKVSTRDTQAGARRCEGASIGRGYPGRQLVVDCAGRATEPRQPGGQPCKHCGNLRADAKGPLAAGHAAVPCTRPHGRCTSRWVTSCLFSLALPRLEVTRFECLRCGSGV